MTQPFDARHLEQVDFERAFKGIREAVEGVPAAASRDVLDSDELVDRVVQIVDKRNRKHFRTIIIGIGVLITIGVVALAYTLNHFGAIDATNSNQDASIQRSFQTIDAFKEQLRVANASLVSQGLPPVAAPEDVVPGSPEQAQLINASAAAKTLDELSKQTKSGVTPASPPTVAKVIATEVQRQVQQTQLMASPDQVINSVGDYVRRNGLPPGPKGETGARGETGAAGKDGAQGAVGPAPSTEEIRSAFRSEVAANPQVLCPLGGAYTSKQVLLANGGSSTQFGCFGDDRPAPQPEQPQPQPDPQPSQGEQQAPGTQAPQAPAETSGAPTPAPQSTDATPSGLGGILGS